MPLILLFVFIFSLFHAFPSAPYTDEDILRINPEFSLKRMSNGEVIIFTGEQANTEQSFSFQDFYADLLLAAHKKQRVEYFVRTIAEKYYLSDDECRREFKHAVNVLSEWNILIME
ncbi:MAG: hypothetical protein JXA61_05730 [Bacteroidales bacterium]|nr:hypothetical protein [Bacteroidales bacterium]